MQHYYRKRFYGNEKTNLTLSDKAEKAYAEILPFLIIEYEDIDVQGNKEFFYEIKGALGDYQYMSADQVNSFLEYVYDKIHANEDEE